MVLSTHEYPVPLCKGPGAMSDIYLKAGDRTGQFLRDVYPTDTAKSVARELNGLARNGARHLRGEPEVSPRTVERWLNGRLPSFRHVLMLATRWPAYLTQVLTPLVSPSLDDLDRQFEAVRLQLIALERLHKEQDMQSHQGTAQAPKGQDRP